MVKSLFLTEVDALYTYDTHQFEAFRIGSFIVFITKIVWTSNVYAMFKNNRIIVTPEDKNTVL